MNAKTMNSNSKNEKLSMPKNNEIVKKPGTLLENFAQLSKESGISLSVMVNHYHDGTVEFNIEFDKELYTDGVPLRTVIGLLNHAVQLIVKRSVDDNVEKEEVNDDT